LLFFLIVMLLPALFVTLPGGQARGQCILANPSFELGGSGGATFGGWNQFGHIGSTTMAVHGAVAAVVTGPDQGGWDVSGYWQRLDSQPGERWEAMVWVGHSSASPLTGESVAIVNIEWRDAGDKLISYESHVVADAATPTDEYQPFAVVSGPAPAGTVATHFLIAVLQSPDDPPPAVFYDQATFYSLQSPTMDEMQWNDFPGGRSFDFSGRSWRVKGPGYYGPGPNLFSDTEDCVWVDDDGQLHLTIRNIGGSWYSTEVTLEEALGYGDYIFTTRGRLDQLDPHAVLGLFIWQYGPCWDDAYLWWNPYNEIDVEFSRWGNPASDIGQFVAQPWDFPGNRERFDASFSEGELTSHAFRWLHDRVEWRSWRGGPTDEAPENLIHSWSYAGPHIPRPEQPRVHINLWQFDGPPASEQEVILNAFTFVPEAVTAVTEEPSPRPPIYRTGRLSAAEPNPFNPGTTIRYFLAEAGRAEIIIYDVAGRQVRVLANGHLQAGEHETFWDGCADSGEQAASGVYLYVLRADDVVETRTMSLVK